MLTFGLKDARRLLPRRGKFSNKSAGGRVLVVAGSRGMYGAAILTSTAALRAGAGYVTLYAQLKSFPFWRHPDFLTLGSLSRKTIKKFDTVAIGPGLGVSQSTHATIKKLKTSNQESVVVDADGLSSCAKFGIVFCKDWILTPHEGELARLLKVPVSIIKSNRLQYAQKAQEKFGCTILLKGHHTLVVSKNKVSLIKAGNSSLAKAGTGDVLTGIISAFRAQGLEAHDAACLGAFVHGYIADLWIGEKNDELALLASDILTRMPKALQKIRSSK